MDNLFSGIWHAALYLDDILVTFIDDRDRIQNLHNVEARIQDDGLKLKLKKCMFIVISVEYLRHVISHASLTLAPLKVEAVLKVPKPPPPPKKTAAKLPWNFYRRFLPNLFAHLQPLHNMLRDGQHWA
ncbi:hypothetical protein MRX96_028871 [Rhipicephalus microplus]